MAILSKDILGFLQTFKPNVAAFSLALQGLFLLNFLHFSSQSSTIPRYMVLDYSVLIQTSKANRNWCQILGIGVELSWNLMAHGDAR